MTTFLFCIVFCFYLYIVTIIVTTIIMYIKEEKCRFTMLIQMCNIIKFIESKVSFFFSFSNSITASIYYNCEQKKQSGNDKRAGGCDCVSGCGGGEGLSSQVIP